MVRVQNICTIITNLRLQQQSKRVHSFSGYGGGGFDASGFGNGETPNKDKKVTNFHSIIMN